MAKLSVAPRAKDDGKFGAFLDEYERRIGQPHRACAQLRFSLTCFAQAVAKRAGNACRAAREFPGVAALLEDVLDSTLRPMRLLAFGNRRR